MDPRREATKETHRKHEMPRAIRAAGGGPIEAAVTGELEGGMFSFSNCEVSTFIPRWCSHDDDDDQGHRRMLRSPKPTGHRNMGRAFPLDSAKSLSLSPFPFHSDIIRKCIHIHPKRVKPNLAPPPTTAGRRRALFPRA
jgi:hypothetical protein